MRSDLFFSTNLSPHLNDTSLQSNCRITITRLNRQRSSATNVGATHDVDNEQQNIHLTAQTINRNSGKFLILNCLNFTTPSQNENSKNTNAWPTAKAMSVSRNQAQKKAKESMASRYLKRKLKKRRSNKKQKKKKQWQRPSSLQAALATQKRLQIVIKFCSNTNVIEFTCTTSDLL